MNAGAPTATTMTTTRLLLTASDAVRRERINAAVAQALGGFFGD